MSKAHDDKTSMKKYDGMRDHTTGAQASVDSVVSHSSCAVPVVTGIRLAPTVSDWCRPATPLALARVMALVYYIAVYCALVSGYLAPGCVVALEP